MALQYICKLTVSRAIKSIIIRRYISCYTLTFNRFPIISGLSVPSCRGDMSFSNKVLLVRANKMHQDMLQETTASKTSLAKYNMDDYADRHS